MQRYVSGFLLSKYFGHFFITARRKGIIQSSNTQKYNIFLTRIFFQTLTCESAAALFRQANGISVKVWKNQLSLLQIFTTIASAIV